MTLEVTVRNNNVEKAMRVLKKKLLKDGMMKELKERQYYSKPSFKKREEKKQAIRRYKNMHEQERIKPEQLFYWDVIDLSWEDTKDKYIKDVGR